MNFWNMSLTAYTMSIYAIWLSRVRSRPDWNFWMHSEMLSWATFLSPSYQKTVEQEIIRSHELMQSATIATVGTTWPESAANIRDNMGLVTHVACKDMWLKSPTNTRHRRTETTIIMSHRFWQPDKYY
ncbi:uncharacterized protein LOC120284997 [Drosophila simulans]|uniref:uncharacterized protein LOC120284997 n=1 Tax=Drosophila simulans TaxID=7240 RepID=UPI00192CE79E|nr:uncharacterized protein LOC120284997 [Drosophila simulans]